LLISQRHHIIYKEGKDQGEIVVFKLQFDLLASFTFDYLHHKMVKADNSVPTWYPIENNNVDQIQQSQYNCNCSE